MASEEEPTEVPSLARAPERWRNQVVAWHEVKLDNGPTEAADDLVERVERTALGFRSSTNDRTRSLLCANTPDRALLATVAPRSNPKAGSTCLSAEQGLGRIDPAADTAALSATLVDCAFQCVEQELAVEPATLEEAVERQPSEQDGRDP